MNKVSIAEAFSAGKAFIPFITCGDPSLSVTEQLVYAMEEAGADLIELGIPFSDPTAEGPVIQGANERALSGGVTTDKIFEMVIRIREKTSIPLLLFMTYANVVFLWKERFIRTTAEIGMNGLILPDVPFEEKEEFGSVCKTYGLELVSLIAPTSRPHYVHCQGGRRLRLLRIIPGRDRGALQHHNRRGAMVSLVKQAKDIPCAIGFGISTPEQAKAMAGKSRRSDCRSAIVKLCKQYGEDCIPM